MAGIGLYRIEAAPSNQYVLRVIEKFPNYWYTSSRNYFENVIRDKEIGLLGSQCRFIVKTIATFHSKVSC